MLFLLKQQNYMNLESMLNKIFLYLVTNLENCKNNKKIN